jgi:hypothetical protein
MSALRYGSPVTCPDCGGTFGAGELHSCPVRGIVVQVPPPRLTPAQLHALTHEIFRDAERYRALRADCERKQLGVWSMPDGSSMMSGADLDAIADDLRRSV